MIETVFGNNLKRLRGINKMTRQAFADAMNLPVTTVAGYEIGGREAKYKTLIRIADFFGVSIDRLLRGNPDDLEMVDKVQLALAENKLSCTIPVGQQDLFVAALPYAGEIINSAMAAVKEVKETNKAVNLTYTLQPADDAQAKEEVGNE